jgi:hypothetical protein
MKVVVSMDDLGVARGRLKEPVGLVPTMGYCTLAFIISTAGRLIVPVW